MGGATSIARSACANTRAHSRAKRERAAAERDAAVLVQGLLEEQRPAPRSPVKSPVAAKVPAIDVSQRFMYENGLEVTPKSAAKQEFRYYCPICMKYFQAASRPASRWFLTRVSRRRVSKLECTIERVSKGNATVPATSACALSIAPRRRLGKRDRVTRSGLRVPMLWQLPVSRLRFGIRRAPRVEPRAHPRRVARRRRRGIADDPLPVVRSVQPRYRFRILVGVLRVVETSLEARVYDGECSLESCVTLASRWNSRSCKSVT